MLSITWQKNKFLQFWLHEQHKSQIYQPLNVL